MHIDERHEGTLVEALRLLSEARSFINMTISDINDIGDKREQPIRDKLTSIAKRISSARGEGEKLIRRRQPATGEDFLLYRSPQLKWGGGPPPFQIDRSELAEMLADGPPEPPEPPPLEPPERS